MPRPVEGSQRYVPALDGVRALAVLCVIAYHMGLGWAQGGMLGVGVFFTLSGYLITDLLLQQAGGGRLLLLDFWRRRARRLLPALILMLAVVSVWVAVFDASQLQEVRRQVISAALYFANWSTIAVHRSYFSRFAAPLPLDHLWSLSIEEQFYLVWPWVVWVVAVVIGSRRLLLASSLLGAAVSAYVMSRLFHPVSDPTRIYEGTDTRAFALLIGAALAVLCPLEAGGRPRRRAVGVRRRGAHGSPARRLLLDLLGLAGIAGIILLVSETSAFSPFLYPTGFLLLSLATVAVLVAVTDPASALGVVLGSRPLRYIGVRSYGIYLWQWPIVVLWDGNDQRFLLGRALLQLLATLVVASLSWRYVEEPIRSGALQRLTLAARAGLRGRRARRIRAAAFAGAAVTVAVAAVGLTGVLPVASAGTRGPQEIHRLPPRLVATTQRPGHRSLREAHGRRAQARGPNGAARTLPPPVKSSCRSVVYIGDSTSEGETSSNYIPNPLKRIGAQLHGDGVTSFHPQIALGNSIVESIDGEPDATTIARRYIDSGYKGCWILAMGVNDSADVAVGSNVSMAARIERMMRIIGNHPVLWVDSITLVANGPYAETHMQRWNRTLLAQCPRYPMMRVFDWASRAKRRWFIPDGIHYYTPGYIARSHLIARALVLAFPRGRPPSASCLVA